MNAFDPATHSYTIDGRPVPSVTTVLGDLLPFWKASPWHMQRGTAVHACAAMLARGQEFDSDPQIAGQLAALRDFFQEVAPLPVDVEQPVYSKQYQYAGTYDMLALVDGKLTMVDYKSALTASVPYQLAAYALAHQKPEAIKVGMGVEIREDGTYRLSERYQLSRYRPGWLALLSAYNIRRLCGIKTEERE